MNLTKKQAIAHFRTNYLNKIRATERSKGNKRDYGYRLLMWERFLVSAAALGFVDLARARSWVPPNFCMDQSRTRPNYPLENLPSGYNLVAEIAKANEAEA